jgi:VIT1/CCC1 family predicted Fe2+/Mn2+ transporter
MLEKNFTPLTAIRKSQEITEGNQWVIFLAPAVFMVGAMIIIAIFNAINETLGSIVSFIIMVLLLPIFLGIQAEIYSKLAADIKPEK